jgi:hypothetical protein
MYQQMDQQDNQEGYNKALNTIFEVKDYISDGDYLNLNNIFHGLRKGIEELSARNININDENDDLRYRNRKLNEENINLQRRVQELERELKRVKEHKSTQEQNQEQNQENKSNCTCKSKWKNDTLIVVKNNIKLYFCGNLKECDNFKELCRCCPLLMNLFERIDMPFIDEPIYQDYDKDVVISIITIFMELVNKIEDKEKKAIVVLVLFDYLLRNKKFLMDHNTKSTLKKSFTETMINKFEELLNDYMFIPTAEKYNVNYKKWHNTIKKIAENNVSV